MILSHEKVANLECCSLRLHVIENGNSRARISQANGCLASSPARRLEGTSSELTIESAAPDRCALGSARVGGGRRLPARKANRAGCLPTVATRSIKLNNAHSRGKPSSGRRREIIGPLPSLLLCLLGVLALINLRLADCKSLDSKSEQALASAKNTLIGGINHHKSQESSEKPTTFADRILAFFSQTTTIPLSQPAATTTKLQQETTTTAAATTAASTATTGSNNQEEEAEEENGPGTGRDGDDAEGCEGISADGSAKATNLTDNERLVNLQSCFQTKVRRQLMGATRSGMEVFEKLSLSGGCSSSLMALTSDLGQLKSYAFKFLDASAKVPSGMMNGLLSDYGDFDQCINIRSNKQVAPEHEAEEGAFSGKYCLMSLKLNYHVKLAPNASAPEGIIEDGILWDDLVRHYWTSKVSKGFQVGMCFPSRCTNDDLNQLYQHVTKSFNVLGEIISCQDSLNLKLQYQPDLLQLSILGILYVLLGLTLIGSLIDRSWLSHDDRQLDNTCLHKLARLLLCFSVAKNWTKFLHGHRDKLWLSVRSADFWSTSGPDNHSVSGAGDRKETNDTAPSSATRSITEQTSIILNRSTTVSSSENVDFIDSDPESTSSLSATDDGRRRARLAESGLDKLSQPLSVRIDPSTCAPGGGGGVLLHSSASQQMGKQLTSSPLAHLSGLKLLIIMWITVGYSFLYPSANNYQYYRSIIRMNITRDSVWFAITNFTLGIDMLLYITGLLFVYKLRRRSAPDERHPSSRDRNKLVALISRKALRFWPTYLTVIGLAIVVPLISDGPMWPEMVSRRLGESCRRNWWANLLFINNFLNQTDICLPSSWFISVLMQLFLVGSVIVALANKLSLRAALVGLGLLLAGSSAFSFCFAYLLKLRAPVIKMDESFVMDLDEDIFRLYTNIFNNLGPFLVGMAGGFLLVHRRGQLVAARKRNGQWPAHSPVASSARNYYSTCLSWLVGELLVALVVVIIAVLVLSSVFYENYSRLASAIYWSLHRIGWAVATGYLVHKCATGSWRLLYDLLSLSAFAPLSKLIFIAYLVYPIYIHIHTGLVRDGLHVSIYNMLNIYITRLVMTFVTALMIHLLVELPFSRIDELYVRGWLDDRLRAAEAGESERPTIKEPQVKLVQPLLAVAPRCELIVGLGIKTRQSRVSGIPENSSSDKLIAAGPTQVSDEGV